MTEDLQKKLLHTIDILTDPDPISLWELPNDNLILKQSDQAIVMSWEELDELAQYYVRAMEELAKKYG